MFGNDSSNNQAQTTTTGFSSDTATSTPSDSPELSTATPPIGLNEVVSPDAVTLDSPTDSDTAPDIPAFIPPDSDGNITKTEEEPISTITGGLDEIKKEALTKLGPLVDKLDQEPVDKFKTLMMMIQASDDQSLIAKAYEAATAISEDSEKARALLDIVNEINYFTGKSADSGTTTL